MQEATTGRFKVEAGGEQAFLHRIAPLTRGRHWEPAADAESISGSMCAMEAAAAAAGEAWTDKPGCVDPTIRELMLRWNDDLRPGERDRVLFPLIFPVIGSARPGMTATEHELNRMKFSRWLAGPGAALWLRLGGLGGAAEAAERLPECEAGRTPAPAHPVHRTVKKLAAKVKRESLAVGAELTAEFERRDPMKRLANSAARMLYRLHNAAGLRSLPEHAALEDHTQGIQHTARWAVVHTAVLKGDPPAAGDPKDLHPPDERLNQHDDIVEALRLELEPMVDWCQKSLTALVLEIIGQPSLADYHRPRPLEAPLWTGW